MAIDSAIKRASVLGWSQPWYTLSVPDATVGDDDKQILLNLYAGITPAAVDIWWVRRYQHWQEKPKYTWPLSNKVNWKHFFQLANTYDSRTKLLGSLSGATWVDTKYGRALDRINEATSSKRLITGNISPSSHLHTVFCEFIYDGDGTYRTMLIDSDNTTDYKGIWLRVDLAHKIEINWGDGLGFGPGDRRSYTFTTALTVGQHYRFAVTLTGDTTAEAYLNGVSEAVASTSGTASSYDAGTANGSIGAFYREGAYESASHVQILQVGIAAESLSGERLKALTVDPYKVIYKPRVKNVPYAETILSPITFDGTLPALYGMFFTDSYGVPDTPGDSWFIGEVVLELGMRGETCIETALKAEYKWDSALLGEIEIN